ncbi:LysR family transcriptional regulator [Aquabacterium sp.]|uniref:LysR family transcriptional regulator n=1 Tax=Aquabacterium sp. TaxID=1872578 RepID=UPI003783CA37
MHTRTGLLDWNDLRTVLAVARSGSLAGAARELDLQHSTVFRRIEEAEARLGARLFDRARTGWSANAQGEAVARAAAEMEAAALMAEREISGADARLQGVIRIATSEMLAGYLLPPLLQQFLAEHPGIEIEADVSNRAVDLTRREADLALRATEQPPESMVGRRVGELRYAIYAARALLPARRAPLLQELPWVGFDERIAYTAIAHWWRQALPDVQPRLRADSLPAMLKAAAAGIGAVALPMFAAAQEPKLLRITPPIEGPVMGLWLLHHPDVRGNARVRTLMQWLGDAVPRELARLTEAGPVCRQCAECPVKPRRRRAA